jgi:ATP-dependent exoDNAse (exonuclease V) beta subunit
MREMQAGSIRDVEERTRALDLGTSFIVRAPAGSGKTDLLTRRFLKLLTAVDEPEEILAITFTRAATAEMRSRVLQHLREADGPRSAEEDERMGLARAALAHAQRRGWRLLEQPHRLNIETIDSLCLRIAHGQPRLARLGGQLNPIERGEPLYALAARRTLGRLGGKDAALNEALAHLLALRDNDLPHCEGLLAGMLGLRDQWIRAFPMVNLRDEEMEWEVLRSQLEAPFRRAVRETLAEAHGLLMAEPLLAGLLLELANYACENGNEKVALLSGVKSLPSPEAFPMQHWRCIIDFLLTDGKWRKPNGLNKNHGFPSSDASQKERKKQMGFLLEQLSQTPGLEEILCAVRDLPKLRYDEDQWLTLRHLFTALRAALAELRVLFAERNEVDFTELSLAAQQVLDDREAGPERLLALSGNIRHLLIDEFQDTSRSQHALVLQLVRAWEAGDGRRCFLVGDPMQSVYMFRQAEVELFYRVEREGLVFEDHCVACEPLQLLTNFRSHSGLTDRWNEMFRAIFGDGGQGQHSGVPFSESFAAEAAMLGEAMHIHPQILGGPNAAPTPEQKKQAREREAEEVLAILKRHAPAIEAAQAAGGEYRVAVLVRARQHLAEIVRLLRERGVAFRAVELETLAERQELRDLLSLTRALLHPMDRIAWLSVLRAPWCGLTLRDLHLLTGADDRELRQAPMIDLLEARLNLLDGEARVRAARALATMKGAMASRFAGLHASSFSQWIERTWRSLGGAECVDATGYENAHVYFTMLDGIAPDGLDALTGDFEEELKKLFAQPDPTVSERAGVQVMTIHRAKGLGFDVVIVPGLDRRPAMDRQSLIVSLERSDAAGNDEMLVAPIGMKGGEKHPTYAWVQRQRQRRADEERKRLLYVACTRARKELHLLGTATMNKAGLQPGDAKSLLNASWPALALEFERFAAARSAREENVLLFPEAGLEIAATADDGPGLKLRRLRAVAPRPPEMKNVRAAGTYAASAAGDADFSRPEGSRRARMVGSVVHALLDAASRGAKLDALRRLARSRLRAAAFSGRQFEPALAEVVGAVERCLRDAVGAWILLPREGAQSEVSWTGWFEGRLQTLRADRVFPAAEEPGSEGSQCVWIIDYKMSSAEGEAVESFLSRQRAVYAPQLARYAQALRSVRGVQTPMRLGLYYPRVGQFDWWAAE